MALDPAVKVISVKHVVGFDPDTLLPSRTVQTTYKVGQHGPFTALTPDDHFTQQYVEEETQKKANILRGLGVLQTQQGM
jgi:hypothetical protein